jgi:hypothetical protein
MQMQRPSPADGCSLIGWQDQVWSQLSPVGSLREVGGAPQLSVTKPTVTAGPRVAAAVSKPRNGCAGRVMGGSLREVGSM